MRDIFILAHTPLFLFETDMSVLLFMSSWSF